MEYVFCTLFDRNYLYKGLALYRSLRAHLKEFTLWILCMDEVTYSILDMMRLDNVKLLPRESFEYDELARVREERTIAEYCWTCTAPLILYVMQQEPKAIFVSYVDADVLFFSDPKPIYDELGNNSILIIRHSYSPEFQAWEATSGIYNVSMVIFRQDRHGIECLNWWRDRCLEACYLNHEAGQCGDQKYLDDWPSRFKNVVVSQHKGVGVAPWNISRYSLGSNNGRTYVDSAELTFYHFHSLQIVGWRFLKKHVFLASKGYRLTKQQRVLVYRPYLYELRRAISRVEAVDPGFAWGYVRPGLREMLSAIRRRSLLLA